MIFLDEKASLGKFSNLSSPLINIEECAGAQPYRGQLIKESDE
jgi:hypothetical protein